MNEVRIVIPGSVASFQKATMTWQSKDGRSGTHAYDKPSYANWRAYARGKTAEQYTGTPIEGPVMLHVFIFRQIPQSLSQKKRSQAMNGWIRPILKPDCSNLLKAIEDACLTGLVIRDDRCIVTVRVEKWFSDKPRVEMVVRPWVAAFDNTINGQNERTLFDEK